jgi:uncharacterized protein YkwD
LPAKVLARRSAATFVTAAAVIGLASTSALAAAGGKRVVHAKAATHAATDAKRHRPVQPKRTAAVEASRPAPAPVTCTGVDAIPTPDNVAAVAATTLCLIDGQRTAAGLGALAPSSALVAAASGHSADMVANDYFAHAAGMNENIAAATGSLATPAAIVAMWMNSPGHRANILDDGYLTTGIGVVAAVPSLLGGGGATYTEDFGPTP